MERSKLTFKGFQKGDKVWLEATNLQMTHPSAKLASKRYGPYEILESIGRVSYCLKLPKHMKVHPVFHASLLTPFTETATHGPNFTEPPPDLIDGEEEFELEAIIAHKPYRRTRRYLVSWKGYPSSENKWLNEKDFDNASTLLTEYKKKHHL